ncbi:SH2 domain-containing adapter protein D [Crotalus adamanteus]|uniref:SH2 domain-containing adapter protein D n=1 Tax=Crotalus adamanteus TaxID=8729 RepID=A0AAW1C3T6_CROAD
MHPPPPQALKRKPWTGGQKAASHHCDAKFVGLLDVLRVRQAGEERAPGESEYSDPFDAHREPKGDAEEDAGLENNGYMEPYDAQKVVADLQRKNDWDEQRGKKSRIGLQLYDTPYEEKAAEAEDPETGKSAEKPPKSRLPQEDERPADEYDQPWEWKKNHISRAFAVDIKENKVLPWPPPVGQLTGTEEPLDPEAQFEAPEWDRTSSSSSSASAPKEHRPRPPKHLTGSAKFGQLQSPESGVPLAERIDLSLPLESQAWFHGPISRAEAETLLMLCREGSYLVRSSKASRSEYSLSLSSKWISSANARSLNGFGAQPENSPERVVDVVSPQERPNQASSSDRTWEASNLPQSPRDSHHPQPISPPLL